MYFNQFYLGCLAHASYLIGSNGEAAVVDPQRDVDEYIEEAAREGLEIRYVIETHLHADFVSGHRELADRTGAEIVFGAKAGAIFDHLPVEDGDEFRVGDVLIKILGTPGHTPESISLLVTDSSDSNEPQRVLTGDTLFIGDVGRPDLVASKGITKEQAAVMLYDSLHGRLLTLPDDVEVWPAHGAGSACGKNLSNERSSTIGIQRATNYALQPMPREDFVRMLLKDLGEPPSYFPMDAEINRRGARALGEIAITRMNPTDLKTHINEGGVVVDVRSTRDFGSGHVPGSINISLSGQYASWAGQLLSPNDRVAIVANDETAAREGVTRLARVGLENASGWSRFDDWDEESLDTTAFPQWTVDELGQLASEPNVLILDVRAPDEFTSGHVPGAINIPLSQLPRRVDEIRHEGTIAVICAGGYRSSIAASLLARKGHHNVANVRGGITAWIEAGFDTAA